MERVDVGVLFHRRCFRCRICGLQLTLKSFHFDQENDPDVYCGSHVPKLVGSIDADAMGIRAALNAPKRGHLGDQMRAGTGWNYDANALEFSHLKNLHGGHGRKHRPSLGTYKDYEELGVFNAQSELEKQHKEEEDQLYAAFEEDKENKMKKLLQELEIEKEKSVQELIEGFEHLKKFKDKAELEKERSRLEAIYRQKKEERMKKLMEKLSAEAKDSVARMIEKHSQEMLLMIAKRMSESESQQQARLQEQQLDLEQQQLQLQYQQQQLQEQQQKQSQQEQRLLEKQQQQEEQLQQQQQQHNQQEQRLLEKQQQQEHQLQQQQQQYREQEQRLLQQKQYLQQQEQRLLTQQQQQQQEQQLLQQQQYQKQQLQQQQKHFKPPDQEDRALIQPPATIRESELAKTPYVSPPEFKKAHLFKNPKEFENIDNHVFEIAKRDYTLFTKLVRDLTVHCETDLEKARAIFRWITLKDLNQLEIDESVGPDTPLGLLRGIKYGTESYHDLFKRLCSYAGLYCEVIQGLSKGAGYRPGMRIEGDKFRNSWTAVNISGSWSFINCNWGARHVKGHVKGHKVDNQTLYYRCDEFYFVTDPEDHIYQHYPDEPRWQLLECPITLPEFIALPVVKSPFFNYGLRFAVHYDCIQYTQNGVVIIQLKIPNLVGFGYTFESRDKTMSQSRLEGRVMLRIVGHNAIFTVAPPKPGRYFFSIYAKDDWNSESLQSACAFRIKCVEKRDAIKSPFPKVPFFGPTPAMSISGVVPETHIDPLLFYSHNDVSIRFKLENPDVKLSYTFKYYGPWENDISDFQRFVFIKNREDTSITYLIRCPLQGKYVFSVLGESSPPSKEDGTISYECLFRYLIECRQPAKDKRPFPRACHRWLNSTLLEPMVGDLPLNKQVSFRVCAPQANDVALLIGDVWFHFKIIHDSIWEGSVTTGSTPGKAKLYAKLDKERSRFSPLIEFQVK